MESTGRVVFSFLFTRRGETLLWEISSPQIHQVASGDPWPGPGVEIDQMMRDERNVWINVRFGDCENTDLQELADRAEDDAEAYFESRLRPFQVAR